MISWHVLNKRFDPILTAGFCWFWIKMRQTSHAGDTGPGSFQQSPRLLQQFIMSQRDLASLDLLILLPWYHHVSSLFVGLLCPFNSGFLYPHKAPLLNSYWLWTSMNLLKFHCFHIVLTFKLKIFERITKHGVSSSFDICIHSHNGLAKGPQNVSTAGLLAVVAEVSFGNWLWHIFPTFRIEGWQLMTGKKGWSADGNRHANELDLHQRQLYWLCTYHY